MKTISDRLKEALYIRGMKQSELAEMTGIGKSSISTYISGDYEPKQRNIYKIAKALDVNEAWLMGHNVAMDRKPDNIADLFTGSSRLISVSPKQRNLLDKYSTLDDKGKHTVETVLEMEYIRCNKPHLVVDAAHAIEGATEEEKQHDNDIMDDDAFWEQ